MPISNYDREDFARTAWAIIGGSKGRLKEGEVAGRVIGRYYARQGTDRELLTLSEHMVIQNIVRGQLRAYDTGRALEDGVGSDVVKITNRDWAISGQGDRYGYRVRVVVENTETGELIERYRIITSNEALSADEVRRRANADVAANPNWRGTGPKINWGAAPIAVEAFIVGAGVNPLWQAPAG